MPSSNHMLMSSDGGEGSDPAPAACRCRAQCWWLLLPLLLSAAVIAAAEPDLLSSTLHGMQARAQSWKQDAPLLVAVGGVLSVAVWIVCAVPSTPIELCLSYLYGFWVAFACVYTGKVLGCLCSYHLGRTRLRAHCWRRLTAYPLVQALELAVRREPWRLCLLARAAYIPMPIKNYGLAVRPAAAPVPPPLPLVWRTPSALHTLRRCWTRRRRHSRRRFSRSSCTTRPSWSSSAAPPQASARPSRGPRATPPRSASRACCSRCSQRTWGSRRVARSRRCGRGNVIVTTWSWWVRFKRRFLSRLCIGWLIPSC